MSSQKCSGCGQLKSFAQYRVTPKGLTGRCISCLDLMSMHKAVPRAAELAEFLETGIPLESKAISLAFHRINHSVNKAGACFNKPSSLEII